MALFAVPVLLSTPSFQIVGMLNLTGEQKAVSQLGGAHPSLTVPATGGGRPAPPGGSGEVLQVPACPWSSPAADDEIALSRTLAEDAHLALGDTVAFPWAPASARPVRIVGTVESPTAHRARCAAGGPGLFAQ